MIENWKMILREIWFNKIFKGNIYKRIGHGVESWHINCKILFINLSNIHFKTHIRLWSIHVSHIVHTI